MLFIESAPAHQPVVAGGCVGGHSRFGNVSRLGFSGRNQDAGSRDY